MQPIETAEDAMRFVESVINNMDKKETPGLYLNFINKYLEDGSIPVLEDDASILLRYVVGLMENPFIQLVVFSKPAMAIIFRETTMRYVVGRLKQIEFHRQLAKSAARDIQRAYQFAPNMRGTNWQSMISKIAEQYEDYGFDKRFMEQLLDNDGALEPQKWNKLIIDWATAFQKKMEVQEVEKEHAEETRTFRAIELADKEISNYLQSSHVSDKEAFEQSINMMHGIWSRTEYEKLQPIVRLQKKYPSIVDVVNKMGRQADEDGAQKIPICTGSSLRLDHSSGSDIEGVTTTRQLAGLLPTELAFYSDEQLSDIFWHKYMQGNLQSFRFRSNIAKPTRQLAPIVHAKQRGPMIVCVDTSGSMTGEPSRIAQSLLARVSWMANRQNRRCYLIYYSEMIHTVDLALSQWAFDDLRQIHEGGTDATEMLTEVFRLLEKDENYMCADVLWISDFMVPDVNPKLMQKWEAFRQSDTRFYGYQIGDRDTIWSARMSRMYQCQCAR